MYVTNNFPLMNTGNNKNDQYDLYYHDINNITKRYIVKQGKLLKISTIWKTFFTVKEFN